jgi:hypothetical protein
LPQPGHTPTKFLTQSVRTEVHEGWGHSDPDGGAVPIFRLGGHGRICPPPWIRQWWWGTMIAHAILGLNWTVAGTLQHQRSALDVAIPITGAPFCLHFSYKTTFQRVLAPLHHWCQGAAPCLLLWQHFKISNDRRCTLVHSGVET